MKKHLLNRDTIRAWILATRPKTLLASVSPVVMGAGCAWQQGVFRLAPVMAALVGAVLLQIVANLANDLFDFEKGADSENRLGPARMVQSGLISPTQMRWGVGIVLAVSLLVGGYLIYVSGIELFLVGLVAIFCAIGYTAGPYPLAYRGWGEVFAFIFFGPVAVAGSAFAASGSVPRLAWLLGASQGFLAAAILVVNNLRDREEDKKAGKRTLAVRWGESFTVWEYSVLVSVSIIIPIVLVLVDQMEWPGLLGLIFIPWVLHLIYSIRLASGKVLNALLAQTAVLMLVHSFFMTLGLVANDLVNR